MKLQVYAVYDSAVGAYMAPFYARQKGEAIRGFTDLANDEKTNVARHPSQFSLFFLGEFDDTNGLLSAAVAPERVVGAHEVRSQEEDMHMPSSLKPPRGLPM